MARMPNIAGNAPSYTDNGDGTVIDNVTGLVWQQSADTDGDGDIDPPTKCPTTAAGTYCENLSLAGYDDWQLPTIKQLYSLMNFSGTDPSGYEGTDTSGLVPFIDTDYFDFAYGDTDANERIIDSQYASSNLYVGDAYEGLLFGVNFADGRIKGYGLTLHGQDKTFTVACIRENSTTASMILSTMATARSPTMPPASCGHKMTAAASIPTALTGKKPWLM